MRTEIHTVNLFRHTGAHGASYIYPQTTLIHQEILPVACPENSQGIEITSYTLTHNKDFLGVLSVFALFALKQIFL